MLPQWQRQCLQGVNRDYSSTGDDHQKRFCLTKDMHAMLLSSASSGQTPAQARTDYLPASTLPCWDATTANVLNQATDRHPSVLVTTTTTLQYTTCIQKGAGQGSRPGHTRQTQQTGLQHIMQAPWSKGVAAVTYRTVRRCLCRLATNAAAPAHQLGC